MVDGRLADQEDIADVVDQAEQPLTDRLGQRAEAATDIGCGHLLDDVLTHRSPSSAASTDTSSLSGGKG